MIDRIKELIAALNNANFAYYNGPEEIMTNKQYDDLYDELLRLEAETGIVLSNSPTQHVGCEVASELPKERHPSPMQSLDKTKDREALKAWLGDKEGVMSLKLDGLTVCATYENGKLVKAVTRGNGEIGELITNNAKQFVNLPLSIPCKDKVVVRGEAIITYSDFDWINRKQEVPYKNPRNLCSGTVRQLDSNIVKKRPVHFVAFELVSPAQKTIMDSFDWLKDQGFEVVLHNTISKDDFDNSFKVWEERGPKQDKPIDGLVLRYNDYTYGESLGRTDKFPRHSMAFKWKDSTETTKLLDIEWNTTRSGAINPVAIFEPVELEGTTVERATLFNVSNIESLELGIGDEITVYKSNMIIPQVDENLTRSNTYKIPEVCPECGHKAVIKQENESKVLFCTNPACKAKLLSLFTHFVSRDCMNIDGLSEATLEKMIDNGWIKDFSDLYLLHSQADYIKGMMALPGLGKRSVNSILSAIDKSRDVQLNNFINALGIPGIGKKQAKEIAEYFEYDYNKYEEAILSRFNFRKLGGFGDVLQNNIFEWYDNVDKDDYDCLVAQMNFVKPEGMDHEKSLAGKTFVITGSLEHFKNRDELVKAIENAGGKTAGSVSKNTNYLINNDINSGSSKNKKAKDLGIPIITEKDFLSIIGEVV